MEGEKLGAAKQAVSAVLHNLDQGDRFRLIVFESRVHPHTPRLVEFTQRSLEQADRWIAALRSMGGTETAPALAEAFAGDTLHDDIEEAIVRLEARIGSPVASGVVPRALDRARPEPLASFSGRSVPILRRGSADSLIFEATDSSGRPIELAMAECRRVTFPLGALWARERVAWLEDRPVMEPDHESALRAEILSAAPEHKTASRLTAFVAVEERVSHTGECVTEVQPVELPQAWSDSFLEFPAMAAPDSFAGSAGARKDLLVARGPSGRWHPVDPRRDIETMLATTQDAYGSFGGRVDRTAAAVVALVCLGHDRHKGTRRRVVQRAAW
jgi:hypothetical protein